MIEVVVVVGISGGQLFVIVWGVTALGILGWFWRGRDRRPQRERGPLVFSYSIGQDWLKLRDRGMTADWQVYPSSRWNYALAVDPAAQSQKITVTEHELGDRPFAAEGTPMQLQVKAKLLPSWMATEGTAGVVPESPVESAEKEETISLIPYAAAKLRITSFPRLKESS